MSWLSDLFSKPKPNLTPAEKRPDQEDLFFSPQLREFARSRINGENLGFGPDFLNRATSAPIASREARFRETELPFLNSQLSSRGMARSMGSGLATDVIGKASANKERDINDLLSKFYVLNETQKKNDQTEALNVAQSMQGQQAGMLENRAAASERLANATAGQQNARTDQNSQMLMQGAQGLAFLATPSLGSLFSKAGGPGSALSSFGQQGLKGSLGSSGARVNTLGSTPSGNLNGMNIEELLALLG